MRDVAKARVHIPREFDGVADCRGVRVFDRRRNHRDVHRHERGQLNRSVVVDGLKHNLVGGEAHFRALGCPGEDATFTSGTEKSRIFNLRERSAAGREGDQIAVWVRGVDCKLQVGKGNHTSVRDGVDDRRLVRAHRYKDLHIANNMSHLEFNAVDDAEFFNQNGNVVFAGGCLGGIPCYGPGVLIHPKQISRIFGAYVGHGVARYRVRNSVVIEVNPKVGGEAETQHITVGVEGAWVVLPDLVEASALLRGVQQLNRVVVSGNGMDNQQRLQRELLFNRVGDVLHPFVSVGVNHLQEVLTRPGVGVRAAVDVDLRIHTRHGCDALAVEGIQNAIPPSQLQKLAVSNDRCLCTGRDGRLVGESAQVPVRNFPGPVVGRPCTYRNQ